MWLGAGPESAPVSYSYVGRKSDFYSLLVDGFTHGHLYLSAQADPRLSSPDPETRRQASRLIDATFFRGRYYLYYGVVPAALVLLPYRALTGQDLSTRTATVFFCLAGAAVSLAWLSRQLDDDGFPRRGGAALVPAATLLASSGCFFLARRGLAYELPIAAGYAFTACFFLAIHEAGRGRRRALMLAWAGLSVGLAVGCRPNHILLLPVLLAWTAASAEGRRSSWWAAFVPAAAVGCALGWYNWARFGSPLEFGFKYGVNTFFDVPRRLLEPRFLLVNLRWYFLTPPSLAPYFPFVFPGNVGFAPAGYGNAEAVVGQFPLTLLAVWIAAGTWWALRRQAQPPRLVPLAVATAGAFILQLLFIGCLSIRANRYMTDFDAPLSFLLGGAAAWSWRRLPAGGWGRAWRLGAGLLAGATALFFLLAALQQFDDFKLERSRTYAFLAGRLNPPYGWFYRAGMGEPGPLALRVRFAPQKWPVTEPLLVTGTTGYTDALYAVQYPNATVAFLFDHHGHGGVRSDPVPLEIGREHRLEVTMGSLYPPRGDPYFRRMADDLAERRKIYAAVRLDGRLILEGFMSSYDAPPWRLELGANGTTPTEFGRVFSGVILGASAARPDAFPALLHAPTSAGVLSYRIAFSVPVAAAQPLMSCGKPGDGYLLSVGPAGPGRYRLQLDDWGYGLTAGEELVPSTAYHRLDMVIGPLAAYYPWPNPLDPQLLRKTWWVWLDGRLLGAFALEHHLETFGALSVARNWQGFTTAGSSFQGSIEEIPLGPEEKRVLLERALAVSR